MPDDRGVSEQEEGLGHQREEGGDGQPEDLAAHRRGFRPHAREPRRATAANRPGSAVRRRPGRVHPPSPGDNSSMASAVRRRTPLRYALALAVVLAVVLGTAACVGPAAVAVDPLVGTCRGFRSTGLEVRDPSLLRRAAALWDVKGGDQGQPGEVDAPAGAVCVVNAHREGGRTVVTLADRSHLATYRETGPGQSAEVTSSPLPASWLPLPLVPVGSGLWQLAQGVTSAEVWVGGLRAMPQRTAVGAGVDVVDVAGAARTFAGSHPGVLAHLVVVVRDRGMLYAATGGPPYAASYDDEVRAVSLGPDDAATRARWRDVLEGSSQLPLVAQAVGVTPAGPREPQQVDQQLTLVATAMAVSAGPVLVVGEESTDGGGVAREDVSVVQPSRDSAALRSVGTIASPSGAWSGWAWLSPIDAGDPDPRELLVMGQSGTLTVDEPLPLTAARTPLVELQVVVGGSAVIVSGPAAVLAGDVLPALRSGATRPAVEVTGRVGAAQVVPLSPPS